MEKIKERTNKYEISVRPKNNKYYEARISLNFGGDCKTRIHKGGKTIENAVLNLLNEYLNFIDSSFKNGLIYTKIDDIVIQKLIKSINVFGITKSDITQKTLEIVNKINYINLCILNNISLQSNVIPLKISSQPHLLAFPMPKTTTIQSPDNIIQNVPIEKCMIQELANEWIKYRLSLCQKTKDNPKPLSQNTVDNNFRRLYDDILPYFKMKKILYLSQITVDIVEGLLKNIDCQNSKHKSYIVLNMLFKYAIKHNKAISNVMEKVEKPPEKIVTGEEDNDENYIEPDKQDFWLDLFEKENTDMSLIFETMLLTRITS